MTNGISQNYSHTEMTLTWLWGCSALLIGYIHNYVHPLGFKEKKDETVLYSQKYYFKPGLILAPCS